MNKKILTKGPLLAEIHNLEIKVWDALVAGDPKADRELLTESFLGVYPSGFANKADHCGQLRDGPTVDEYQLSEMQLRVITESAVLLSYRAAYCRPGQDREVMFISSLWEKTGDGWLNSFSQDTPEQ